MDQVPSYLRSIDQVLGANTSPASQAPTPTPTASGAPSFNFQTVSASPSASPSPASQDTGSSSQKRVKFLLCATHAHQFTGYSKVTYNMVQELSKNKNIEVVHFGFQRHPQVPPDYRPYPSNVKVVDAAALENPLQQGFGYTAFVDVIRRERPHVVMIYNDMSVVARFLEEIRKSGIPRDFKIWVYCDQVYDCQLQGMIDILNRDADRVFAFTPYWKKCLKDQGVTRPLDVILHGFDSKTYVPIPRETARNTLKLPNDAFVIMNLNRNQPRKRLDVMIMAFVELIVKYPTKPIMLLCICDKGEKGGWWLFELYVRELKKRGVPVEQYGNRLMISSQDMVFRDEDVNLLYNIADVGISTAEGEGWGLCNFEQMGVGIPQVVPDLGGYKEFCTKENSVVVKPKYSYYLPGVYSPVGGEAYLCDPHDVCLALEEYITDSDKRRRHGGKAREDVLKYTWERAFKDLVRRLEEERNEL